MANPNFAYDRRTLRYRYTDGGKKGQFVSEASIRKLIDDYIVDSKDSFRAIGKLLLDKHITVSTFEASVAKQLKSSHIASYLAGRGGKPQMTQRDFGVIGARLKSEYQYLRGFSEDILAGNLSEAQILSRLELYQDSFFTTYSMAVDESAKISNRWEKWNSADDGGTCSDCSAKSARGWQPIGTLGTPGIGTKCRSRCRCWKKFSNELVKPSNDRLLGQRFGWLETGSISILLHLGI